MASQILKPECSFFTLRPETVMIGRDPSPSGLSRALLLLNRATGAILGGVGLTVLVANVLIGCALLIGGADFVLELLGK